MRNVLGAMVLLSIAVLCYFGSFHGARSVLAHGTHCGGANPPVQYSTVYDVWESFTTTGR